MADTIWVVSVRKLLFSAAHHLLTVILADVVVDSIVCIVPIHVIHF